MPQDSPIIKKQLPGKTVARKLEWLGVQLIFLIFRNLSFETTSRISGRIARWLGPHLSRHRRAEENLRRAFPEWADEQVNTTLMAMWDNLGRYLGELPHMASMTAEECHRRTDFAGLEHFHAAVSTERSTLFFSAHMGNWEWGAKGIWALDTPLSIVYRPLNNPHLEEMVTGIRDHYQKAGLPKSSAGGRELIRTLGRGDNVAILIDQRMRSGNMIPFFGHDAPTSSAMADMALKYESVVLPTRVERLENCRFRLSFEAPIDTTGKTPQEIMGEAHAVLERWIRERPEQWFWVHRRWDA